MSLFSRRDDTLLRRYLRELKNSQNFRPNPKKQEAIKYLNSLKDFDNIVFDSEEVLIDVLNNYIENDGFGTEEAKIKNLKEYLEKTTQIYQNILSINLEKNELTKEKITNIMNEIIKKGFNSKSILEIDMFDHRFFNLFKNKKNYLLVMEIIQEHEELQNNWDFDRFIEYAFKNRRYFHQEEEFAAHLIDVLGECLSSTATNYDELYGQHTVENKKGDGFYDIDENLLEELDNLITAGDGVLQQLQVERRLSADTVLDLKRELETAVDNLKAAAKVEVGSLSKKTKDVLDQFKLDINKALQEEINKFRTDTDKILAEVDERVQEKVDSIAIINSQFDDTARSEVQRIREAGLETEKRIKQAISEHPELEEVLAKYLPVGELVAKLDEATTLIQDKQTIITPAQKIITVPTIITPREIPKDINPFFDPKTPFSSRFNRLLEAKQKKEEEEGEIYHEKFDTLLKMIIENCNPYIWGGSGIGKTYMIKQAFELLGQDYYTINKILEDYELLGYTLPNGDYSNPLWYQCYKYGYGAFLDELDSSNSAATITINSFTANKDGSSYSFPNGEIVYRHPNFRIVAAGNTAGTGANDYFSDRTQLEESVQQRLMPLELTPDPRIEQKILAKYPDWYEFTQNFRKATDAYAASRKIKSAPGELTTRDTDQIRQLKEDNAFTDKELIEYQIIENKDADYLDFLQERMKEQYGSGHDESRELFKIFSNRVDEIKRR